MKKFKSIIALNLVLCLLLTSCASSGGNDNSTDYSATLGENIKFFNQPTEEYIIECLENVATINGIAAVTEENDPNGKLNKDGGYISAVYFSSSLVQQETFSKNELIEKGTSVGGCIEVFKTVEDANNRNEYLSEFDGGLLDSGSHVVVGTVIIRISSELSNTQQKELEENIINAFVTIEEATSEESTTIADETVSETEESTTEETTTEESTTESTTKKAETTTNKKETTTKKSNSSVSNDDSMVWIPKSPGKYHDKSSCSGMKNPTQVTKEEAEDLGYEPCKKCYK